MSSPFLERAVETFVLINFAVIGLSHAIAPRAWVEYFQWLHGKGHAGVFAFAFIPLTFGSLVAAFHPVWHGAPLIMTFLGWAQVFKGALYFAFPAFGLKQLGRVTPERAHLFRWAGIAFLILTAVLARHLLPSDAFSRE